jgi:hypothetical protein
MHLAQDNDVRNGPARNLFPHGPRRQNCWPRNTVPSNLNRTTMKVLVDSEFEHKCFLINFETLQTVLDKVKDFLNDEGVKKAGDVLQKIGVLGGTVATGVFGYLRWRNGLCLFF